MLISQLVAGLRRGFNTYGLTWDENLLKINRSTNQHEYVQKFVKTFRDENITAVFVPHWSTIMILMQELSEHQLSIPKDLSLVAYGEAEMTPYMRPKATRFELNISSIAEQAAKMIIEHDRDNTPLPSRKYISFPVELLIGKSTASLYSEVEL